MADEDLIACLRLGNVHGVGPIMARRLREAFGSARSFWEAGAEAWRALPGVGDALVRALRASSAHDAEAMLERCRQLGVQVLCQDDALYPEALLTLSDAPLALFLQGDVRALHGARSLTVVGARKATREGRGLARDWCRCFSHRGVVVVSGMAQGIDTAAHGGALEGEAPTVAVLGCGLATLYPLQQRQRDTIVEAGGCVLSEYPPEQRARPEYFPRRNRILATLTLGTLVVEAELSSGSLITARHAVEHGREVMAVPGSVYIRGHAGCHRLIREGAQLVESADDVFRHMDWPVEARAMMDASSSMLDGNERRILELLRQQSMHVDQLADVCRCDVSELASSLLSLELRGLIESLPGGCYGLVHK